ncbi:hypothetical protein KZO11_33425 [Streptomyces anulatus]|uniref:hypothetical protein n=1 Tax=Streptomyces anulatus TaxID=1892 RepID=UPI001C5F5D91|nr:hypothetical protein [Streptomyces anulatus]QYA98162.1 hypothetical protein KZO11_33425 [Streptomyces anulatus]
MAEAPAAAAPVQATPNSLREVVTSRDLANLTGPLGSGKSRLVAGLGPVSLLDLDRPGALERLPTVLAKNTPAPLVVDSADDDRALAALEPLRLRRPGSGRPVLVVSRRSLLARPGWADTGVAVVETGPWPDARIGRLTAEARVTDARCRELIVRLAAGNPLIADAACRAVHAGAPPTAAGAVADGAAREIVERLSRERPAGPWQHALVRLATVWSADEELLDADPDLFDTLAGLSPVVPTELGLALTEPFRGVIELAHRWRRPAAHRGAWARALAHRKKLLADEPAAERRSRLTEGIIALADDDAVRETMFPISVTRDVIHTATPDDADTIGTLMRQWARQGGLDVRWTDRLVERWLVDDPASFQLIRDGGDRIIGLTNTQQVTERTMNCVEPLLQQHTDRLLGRPRGAGGWLLGAAYCPDRGAHAHLLRGLLRQVITGGLLLTVSTPNPDYQRLLRGLRFQRHGTTTDDVYRCGRKPEIFSQDFGSAALPDWTERLARTSGARGGPRPTGQEVARALAVIADPARLAESPLLSSPRPRTVAELRADLWEAVRRLADSEVREEAEAGWILQHYYLGRPRTHQRLAQQLHISRATYFRRLRHGLDLVGGGLAAERSVP